MKSESLQILLGGDKHQIDINTLINTLTHNAAIITQINEIYGNGTKKIDIKVNAIKEGSFLIDISILESAFKTLFSSEGMTYLAAICTVFNTAWQIYFTRKGKPVKNKEEVSIPENITKNISQDVIINIYNNQVVRRAINDSIKAANQDAAAETIEIKCGEHNEPVIIPRSEFSELEYDDFDKENDTIIEPVRHIVDENARLRILTLSSEKRKHWQFLYQGNKIDAIIKDEALYDRINKGDRFAIHDSITAKLEISQVYNSNYEDYVNDKYRVLEIIGHKISENQQKLL